MGHSRHPFWAAWLSQTHLINARRMPFALARRRDKRPEIFSVSSLTSGHPPASFARLSSAPWGCGYGGEWGEGLDTMPLLRGWPLDLCRR